MKKQPVTKQPAKVVALTADFLKSRGLPRDKANYVMAVIRMRQEVRHLLKTTKDAEVHQELLCLDEFFDDTVTTMYAVAAQQAPTPTTPKGAA